ncbi:hypothetical protein SCALM49S_09175 [Streptomyces californicus]
MVKYAVVRPTARMSVVPPKIRSRVRERAPSAANDKVEGAVRAVAEGDVDLLPRVGQLSDLVPEQVLGVRVGRLVEDA